MKHNKILSLLKEFNITESFVDKFPEDVCSMLFTKGYATSSYSMSEDGLFFERFKKYIGNHISKRYPHAYDYEYQCMNPNRRDSFDESMIKHKILTPGVYYTFPEKYTILETVFRWNEDDGKWKFTFTAYGKYTKEVINKINFIWQKMKFTSYKHLILKNKRITVNECIVYNTQNGPKKRWTQTPTSFKDISEVVCADKEQLISRIDSFMDSENLYKEKNVPYRLGILLYGPPGTGKTTLALSLSDYIGAYITINVTVSSLSEVRLWWNDQHNKSINMNDMSKKHSSGRRILFIIEEIDQWFSDDEDDRYKSEKIHELLQFIDSLDNQAIVVGTTNHYHTLSNALIRAGRFDLKIQMGEFNEESALEFIRILNADKAILDMLTPDENGNYSPVEIQDLAFQMRLSSIHKALDIDDVDNCNDIDINKLIEKSADINKLIEKSTVDLTQDQLLAYSIMRKRNYENENEVNV